MVKNSVKAHLRLCIGVITSAIEFPTPVKRLDNSLKVVCRKVMQMVPLLFSVVFP